MRDTKRLRWQMLGLCVCAGLSLGEVGVASDPLSSRYADMSFSQYYSPYPVEAEPNLSSYSLPLSMTDILNIDAIDSTIKIDSILPLICANGFALVEPASEHIGDYAHDMVKMCRLLLDSPDIPLFVTTDMALHLFHIQFDQTLQDIEEQELIGWVNGLTDALLARHLALYSELRGDLAEAARRNVAFLSVAKRLFDPSSHTAEFVDTAVATELARIQIHDGFANSSIFGYQEDYSSNEVVPLAGGITESCGWTDDESGVSLW